MRRSRLVVSTASLAAVIANAPCAQRELPTIEAHTAALRAQPGLVPLFEDARGGRVFAELPLGGSPRANGTELLYATAIASGLGSNPIGLDRGSLGPQHVVEFRRRGPKVLLVAKNLDYRALSDDVRERAAVGESFAESVLGAFEIVASSEGRVLVDLTELVLRDATGIARRAGGGASGAEGAAATSYELDRARSAIESVRAFPDNCEIEVLLTFHSKRPNRLVAETAASDGEFSLRVRHSFVRLPSGYVPRAHDPRLGYSSVDFLDYAAPIDAPIQRRWITRHRLERRDPNAARGPVTTPIVYHVDPGVPEPVRSALKEGAGWWADAFAAAGFEDAFRVADLPAGADALDVRHHVIHWVHRSTRGWSYGSSVRDPRTGEILKGNVLLGSLRVRQDHLIFTGLGAPRDGCCAMDGPDASHLLPFADQGTARELALQRIRQLAAHEVGHTLGLTHNFAASSYGRASVMDYPAPWVRARDGELDFGDAYATGVGDYDRWAIRWGYAQFAPGADEAAELEAIVREGLARGFLFLTDQDARAGDTAHPFASLWDNGADAIAELANAVEVRRIGLGRFGLGNLRDGAPLSELEQVLVPTYLHHRYQLEAALKLIGGVDYSHAVRGDGQPEPRAVPLPRQRQAIDAVLALLEPDFLALPEAALSLIPPAAPGTARAAERFARDTGDTLDPVAIARAAAELVVVGLCAPARAARLQLQPPGDDFGALVDRLVDRTWRAPEPERAGLARVQREVQALVVDHLMRLGVDESANAEVRAVAHQALAGIAALCSARRPARLGAPAQVHAADTARRIALFLADPRAATRRVPSGAVPPGAPIGSDAGR